MGARLLFLATNLFVTMAAVSVSGFPVVAANVVAVARTSVLNFWMSGRFVFRR